MKHASSNGVTVGQTLPLDFSAPTKKDVEQAHSTIRESRFLALQRLLRSGDEGSARIVAAIVSCVDRSPEAAVSFLDKWQVAFALRCLADSENPQLAQRVLLAMAFASDKRVRNCVDGTILEIVGRRGLAMCGFRIHQTAVSRAGEQLLRVYCRSGHVEVETSTGRRTRMTPPLRPDSMVGGVALTSLPTSRSWQLSVVDAEDFNLPATLFYGKEPDGSARSKRRSGMPVRESLEHAHDLVTAIWPVVPAWARLLAPSVLRVRQRAFSAIRLSGSFGPGYPIYLSDAGEPRQHAEDMIHELQHLRFHVWRKTTGWPNPVDGQRFLSPFRTDLRPLLGLHLGLHAFITVNEFRLRTAESVPLPAAVVADTALLHQRNLFAFRTVADHEVLTRTGRRYLKAVAQRLAEHHEQISRLSTRVMRSQAQRSVRRHIRTAGLAGPTLNANLTVGWDSLSL